MSVSIRLKHSSVQDKAPTAGDLTDGELALNVNANSPAAYIKDSAGNIVKLAGAGAVGSDDQWTRTGTELAPTNAGDDVFTSGDVRIGNTTGAPNISLKADGSGTFAGNVLFGGEAVFTPAGRLQRHWDANPNGGYLLSEKGQFIIKPDGDDAVVAPTASCLAVSTGSNANSVFQVIKDGTTNIGGTIPSAPNISLNADGSAEFAGNVGIGTTNPQTLLNLRAASGDAIIRLENSNTTIASGEALGAVEWYANDSSAGGTAVASKINVVDENGFGTAYGMGFYTGIVKGGNYALAESLRINNNGSILIGDTLPASPNITLTANGIGQFGQNSASVTQGKSGVHLNGEKGVLGIYKVSSDPDDVPYMNCGRDPNIINFRITKNGSIEATNTTVQPITSERRLKENIAPIDSDTAWDTIKSTPYYSYNFIGNSSSSYGPMADEVPDDIRIATNRSDDVGVIHTYDNGMLQARLYTALQTALNRIEALEAEVEALKNK